MPSSCWCGDFLRTQNEDSQKKNKNKKAISLQMSIAVIRFCFVHILSVNQLLSSIFPFFMFNRSDDFFIIAFMQSSRFEIIIIIKNCECFSRAAVHPETSTRILRFSKEIGIVLVRFFALIPPPPSPRTLIFMDYFFMKFQVFWPCFLYI